MDDRAARKAAFAKLQRFVVEQALQAPQYIMFGVTVRSKRVPQGNALAVVQVDGEISPAALEALRGVDAILQVHVVTLNGD